MAGHGGRGRQSHCWRNYCAGRLVIVLLGLVQGRNYGDDEKKPYESARSLYFCQLPLRLFYLHPFLFFLDFSHFPSLLHFSRRGLDGLSSVVVLESHTNRRSPSGCLRPSGLCQGRQLVFKRISRAKNARHLGPGSSLTGVLGQIVVVCCVAVDVWDPRSVTNACRRGMGRETKGTK